MKRRRVPWQRPRRIASGSAAEHEFLAAQHLHAKGQLTEAAAAYRRLARARPGNFEALYGLGAIAAQRGDHRAAETWISRAVNIAPNHAEANCNLGIARRELGRLDAAIECFERALALKPDYPEAHYSLGVAHQMQKRWSEAIASYRKALALEPSYAAAHYRLGLVLEAQGRVGNAVISYQRAVTLDPDYVDAHFSLGNTAQKLDRFGEAVISYRRALELRPDYAEVYVNLGVALQAEGRREEAMASYRKALDLKPDFALAHYNLGNALREQGRLDEAVASIRQALVLDPASADAHFNLGVVLGAQGRQEDATAAYQNALALRPDFVKAHNNLGAAYQAQGHLDDAIASFERALALQPDYPAVHANLAMALFLKGEFARAAEEYEWRWQAPGFTPLRKYRAPPWDGRPLLDGAVLLWLEQGYGDAIQFVRYAPLVRERCGRVVLDCPAELAALLATAPGVDEVAVWGGPTPAVAAQAPLMRLMRLFGTRLETIPARAPYLAADPARVAKFRERIEAAAGLKVGLVWAGRPNHVNDRNRSLPLAALRPLLEVEGSSFFSLQKGPREAELVETGLSERVVDLAPLIGDFADTAAAISCLDMVISVDTAVAHLAGALAKPVWTLLPLAPDWRWLLEREDSPWYPTMRLFRQPGIGDWASVVRSVVVALQAAPGDAGLSISAHERETPARRPQGSEDLLAEARRHHQSGRLDEAEVLYQRIVAINPENFHALYGLGAIAAQRSDHCAAERWIGRALEVTPDHAEAHYNLGVAQREQGHVEAAEASFRQAIALRADYVEAHYNNALALKALERLEEAAASFGRALALEPNHVLALFNLGLVLEAQDQTEDAAASYSRAVALDPNHVEAYFRLGNALHKLRRPEEAVVSYRRALTLRPISADLHLNLGVTLQTQNRLQEAMASYRRAIELKADYAEAHFGLASILLLTGNFADGTAEYEWRSRVVGAPHLPEVNVPMWDGRPILDGTLLVRAEQGFGDAIQCVRYAPLVRKRCGRVVLECQAALMELMATVPGVDAVVPWGRFVVGIAAQVSLMSLMRILETQLATIPATVPYLTTDAERLARFRERICAVEGLRVGLVWAGNPNQPGDRGRWLALWDLLPLLNVPEVSFFSLQKGPRESDIVASDLGCRLIDLAPLIDDFADTAAAISCLDLVISVDTAVAHLAGALAKPVWTLLPFAPDWRWLLGRDDSPWYPTMRLFRQPTFGDWASVVAAAANALLRTARGEGDVLIETEQRASPRRAVNEEELLTDAQRHHRAGRLMEAERLYRRILTDHPDHFGALYGIGAVAAQRGDNQAAESWIGRALAVAPDHVEANYNLGIALSNQGRYEDAIASFQHALALKPDYADAHFNLGNAVRMQNRIDEAVASYGRALVLSPESAATLYNLGNILQTQGKFGEAISCYERAVAVEPRQADIHLNLGNALQATGKLDEAVARFEMVLRLVPTHAGAYFNIGNARNTQRRWEEAVANYERALALKSDYFDAHNNLALALQSLGRLDEARRHFEKALELQPENAGAKFNLGLILLLTGDFEKGTAAYECRREVEGASQSSVPPWDGGPLPGKAILLQAEQGLGDTIQFARYAPLVRARCGRVVVQCPPQLAPLLATIRGVDEVISTSRLPDDIAVGVPFPSLMHLFGTRLETVPAAVPYVDADPVRVSALKGRIAAAGGLKVGLVWSGNPSHKKDRERSLPLSALAPVLAVEGITFFSLQKGAAAEEIALAGVTDRLIELAPELNDFADTAAAVSCLDLVISVDTAVAHLAGALAKPVWTMIPYAPDWRWLLDRSDSPWYPTMRMYRQPALGDWASVVADVAGALRGIAHGEGRFLAKPTHEAARTTDEGEIFAEAQRHHQAGRLAEAETLYQSILAVDANHVGALRQLGMAALQRGDHQSGEKWMRRVLAVAGEEAEAYAHLGNALYGQKRLDEAASCFRQAVAIEPAYAMAHFNLANALREQGLVDEAVSSYRRAVGLAPNHPEIYLNLGVTLRAQGDVEAAIATYERALALKPDYSEAHFNLGLALMLAGNIARGAREYEWRWRVGNTARLPHIDVPLWDDRQQVDGALLVRAEQGLGDTIQFVRFAGTIRPRCRRLVLQCLEPLAPLMGTALGVDEVIVWGQPVPAVAAQVPLISLMRLLGTELETIPAHVPYLAADATRVRPFQERIGGYPGLKVGVVWAGNPGQTGDRYRSLPLSGLQPVFEVEGVSFFSLQKGPREEELAASPLRERIVDLAPLLGNLADTAAAISCLDLVISVDTAVAHLTGALAKPVWTLLPFAPDWRWLVGREDTPWYPTMRLFRQFSRGDWTSVINAVAEALRCAAQDTGASLVAAQRQTKVAGVDAFSEARRHHQAGRLAEAESFYREVVVSNPRHFGALYGLGCVAAQRGDHQAAETWIGRAVGAAPDHVEAHYNLGNARRELGRFREAALSFRQALALKPEFAHAHHNLGLALHALGRFDEAAASFRQAAALKPDLADAHTNLAITLRSQGQIDEAIAACRRAFELQPQMPLVHSNLLLSLQCDPRIEPRELFLQHRGYGARMPSTSPPTDAAARDPEKRLKIGYVSPDLRAHPVGFFLVPMLAMHDRARFAVHCYYGDTQEDGVTAFLKNRAEVWRSTVGVSDDALAAMIRADGIDILVDLAGHTGNNRLPVFARKPAPVQVTWLGYPDTTGLTAIDYRLTDAVADPQGEADWFASETLVRLPHGFHCYQPPGTTPPVAAPPLLAAGHVTFGCFNILAKVNPGVVSLWAAILRAVPTARLLLKSRALSDDATRRLWAERFAAHGIEPHRIELFEKIPSFEDHLALYGRVDIALDPFPYNGATTTCDALWMGVPVVTLRGNRHAARVGASLLSTVGLQELIANDPDSYLAIATDLARDADRLAALRAGLRDRMRASPLCDMAGFTRDIETAYRSMWRHWCARPTVAKNSTLIAGPPVAANSAEVGDALRRAGEDIQAGRLAEAEASYHRILGIDAEHFGALYGLGAVAARRGDHAAVETWIGRAVAIDPNHAEAYSNLGNAQREQGRLEEAVASLRRALALRPDHDIAYSNLGAALLAQGRVEEAEESFERAIALKPDFVLAHYNLGFVLLLKGDFARGATEYEWRWRAEDFRRHPPLEAPTWDGQPMPGKTLLLRAEQGFGDAVQFARYAPLVRARCGRVVLQCDASLTKLLSTTPGVDEAIAWRQPLPAIAAHAPLLTLMHLLGTRLESIPATVPYLSADPVRVTAFRRRTGAAAGLKVGLAWAGTPGHSNDRNRSLALAALRPLLEVDGASFFSLQKGPREGELAESSLSDRLVDLAPLIADFADAAAAISCLDLVISVDTAVAHLAGALAKPVWTLLPFAPDWRWLLERSDSPWYPTMRLFRQPSRGDWASVINAVARALRRAAQDKGASLAAAQPQLGQPIMAAMDVFTEAQRHHQAGRLAEAEAHYRQLLSANPDHIGGLHYLGIIAAQRGDQAAAEKLIGRALSLAPDFAEGHYELGNALTAQGRPAEAIASYNRALALEPSHARAQLNLGNALQAQGRLDEAIVSFERVLEVEPNHAGAHYNIGNARKDQGRLEQAVASYKRAIALRPDFAEPYNNLGNALQSLGRLDEAVASLERAIALMPSYGGAHFNLSLALLLRGDFERGTAEYEWRWQAPGFTPLPNHKAPLWDGRPLPDGAVLLRVEQGYGDAIQFIRYAPLVRQRCGRVVLECPPALAPLMSAASGVDEVAVWGGMAPAAAAQMPLMSLMRLFETRLETIPASVPYLAADPARVARFWERIEAAPAGLKVGLVWAGRPSYKNERNRSLALAALRPLLEVEGASFFSLQKGPREGELAESGLGEKVTDLAPLIDDFADTAAAISCLDLVISADTAAAHLAGALAKPVWTLLPFAPDWRWLLDRTDSPWYPTMRLYRQPSRGDWQSVLGKVVADLSEHSSSKRTTI